MSKRHKPGYDHEYSMKHKEKKSATSRKWRSTHKVEYNAWSREWWKKNAARALLYRLKNVYDLSREEYKQMLVDQDGVCYLCHQPPRKRELSVDHDHVTGTVRGLLCERCNVSLGVYEAIIKVAGEENIKFYLRRGSRWTALSD